MKHLPNKITPHFKRGFRLSVCTALLGTLSVLMTTAPTNVFAQTAQEAEMAALYEQAFGKSKKTKYKKSVPPKVKSAPPLSSASSNKPDKQKNYSSNHLAALYTQAFGKPAHQQIKKSSHQNESTESAPEGMTDLAALYAQAFGKKAPMAMPTKVNVDIRINKIAVGDITLFSNKQGVMDHVDSKELLASLKDILKEHIFKRIQKKLSVHEKVNIKTLSTLGMKAYYNGINLSLDLHINPALRKPQILSLYGKKKASVRDENKISGEEISAFLNMYTNIGINSHSSKPDFKMKLEGSLGIKNAVLETSVDLNNKQWDLGRTTLTYDKPDKLQRFVVGNISTGSRNFQENMELIGIRASKEFFMKPDLQIRPQGSESFVLETKSEVEVFINNQLRQRFYLDEGIYSLQDIGLYDGANNIRVRITDEFGKVTTKTSQQYYDSHLLKPELALYSVSLGYLSNKQTQSNNALIHKPILSAYYEKGINKNLTMSLDAQISPGSYLLGAEAITSIPLGSLKQSIAVSGGRDKASGFAARLEFKPNIKREVIKLDTLREDMLGLDTSVGKFLNSMTITEEFRSRNFSMLTNSINLNNHSKQLKAQIQTRFSFDLKHNWRGQLSVGITDYYNSRKSVSANLSAIKRFNNGINLSVGANYDSRDDFSVSLRISIPLDRQRRTRREHLELLANSKDKSISSKLSYKPTSNVGKNSLAGSVELIKTGQSNKKKLNLHYRNPHYETNFTAVDIAGRGSNSQRLSVGINTSLACVGKHCGTSYPIQDSFALVGGPSNQSKPIAINNGSGRFSYSDDNDTGLPDKYTSIIPKKGAYAVMPLESYRYQNINIDEATLPNGYDTEKTEFEVFPRYHQGFLIKAGGEPATIVDGILLGENKKPLGFKGGQWVPVAKKGKTIAFFSNKAGRFRITSMPAGRYKLDLFDYPDMRSIIINVPNKKGQVHDVGSLVVIE